jgi:copper(I)-binding protein
LSWTQERLLLPFFRPQGLALPWLTQGSRRQVLRGSVAALACALPGLALAHGVSKGELLIDHPYALPSAPGQALGQVYFRGIKNAGVQADRLLGADTPAAARVALNRFTPDVQGTQTLPVDVIDLPAKTTTLLRHTGGYQLTLLDLKKPLKDGDRFELTLFFEHAGHQTVQVWVLSPRALSASHSAH